jgi:hypothetical protein
MIIDKTIEQLNELSVETVDKENDFLSVFDISASETKKIKIKNVLPDQVPIDGEQGEFLILGGEQYTISNVTKALEPGFVVSSITPETTTTFTPDNVVSQISGNNCVITTYFNAGHSYTYGDRVLFYIPSITGMSQALSGYIVGECIDENYIEFTFYNSNATGTPVFPDGFKLLTGISCETASAHGFPANVVLGIRDAVGVSEILISNEFLVSYVPDQYHFSLRNLEVPIQIAVNTYTPNSATVYLPGNTSIVNITTTEINGISENDYVYIPYDQRILGFANPVFGKYQVSEVLSQTSFSITLSQTIGSGTFSSGGPIELLKYPKFNFYFNGNKTVEVMYKTGKTYAHNTIEGAIVDARQNGGLVVVHPRTQDYNERIILRNGVNVKLEESAVVNYTGINSSILLGETNVTASIYGNGIIKQTCALTGAHMMDFNDAGSNISITCEKIIRDVSYSDQTSGGMIGILQLASFNLKCDHLWAMNSAGLWLVTPTFNINCRRFETGVVGLNNSGSTAILTNGNGFIDIDELIVNNLGHCLSPRSGRCVANVRRLHNTNNSTHAIVSPISILSHQADSNTELYLTFDDARVLPGVISQGVPVVEIGTGTFAFIGRNVETFGDSCITVYGNQHNTHPKGLIKIDRIHSNNWAAVNIDTENEVIIKDSNLSASSDIGVNWGALTLGYAKAVNTKILNTTIKQISNNANSNGIKIFNNNGSITLDSVSIDIANASAAAIKSVEPDTQVKIRRPLWMSTFADSNTSIINPGITIQ